MVAQPIGTKKAIPGSGAPKKAPIKKAPVSSTTAKKPAAKKPTTTTTTASYKPPTKKPIPSPSSYKPPTTTSKKPPPTPPAQQSWLTRGISGATSAVSNATSAAASGVGSMAGAAITAAGNGVAGAGKGAGNRYAQPPLHHPNQHHRLLYPYTLISPTFQSSQSFSFFHKYDANPHHSIATTSRSWGDMVREYGNSVKDMTGAQGVRAPTRGNPLGLNVAGGGGAGGGGGGGGYSKRSGTASNPLGL